jgi:hypothetical protein
MSPSVGIGALVLAVSCFSSAAILVSGQDALIVERSKGREIQPNKRFDDYLGNGNRPLFIQTSSCLSWTLIVFGIVAMFF